MDEGSTSGHREPRLSSVGCLAFAVPLVVLLSPIIALALAWEEFRSRRLYRQFARQHGPAARGLLVYSNSPNWQGYIEREWLPRLEGRLVILNWSERARWAGEQTVEAALFRLLGDREFNPAAIVFRPLAPGRLFRRWVRAIRELDPIAMLAPYERPVEVVRFFQPFRDHKHGRTDSLRAAERRLWAVLDGEDGAPDVVQRGAGV